MKNTMKRSFLKKQSPQPVARIKRRIQKLLTQICRVRDKQCILRNLGEKACSGHTCADHIISRQYSGTYWNPDNCILLCSYHHLWWKPSSPIRYTEIVTSYLGGREKLIELQRTAKQIHHYTQKEWLQKEEFLKEYIKGLD